MGHIPFAAVGQEATSLPFAPNIGSTTLGLLINSEIPMDYWGGENIVHLCFPALCSVTDEPLLLRGSLLTLSDGAISLKEHTSSQLENMDTEILKIQVYQDEIQLPWQQLTDGPVKFLLELVPQLRLCGGRQCGKNRAFFHGPVSPCKVSSWTFGLEASTISKAKPPSKSKHTTFK